MRILVLLVSFLFSASTFASGLKMTMIPEEPLVSATDIVVDMGQGEYVEVAGPWFSMSLNFKNADSSDIYSIYRIEVRVEGHGEPVNHTVDAFQLGGVKELAPGETFDMNSMFIGSLPGVYHNTGEIRVFGWQGPADKPGAAFNIYTSFHTK